MLDRKRHIEAYKWHEGPLEQLELFIYSVAIVNIVSMETEKTLITDRSEVGTKLISLAGSVRVKWV